MSFGQKGSLLFSVLNVLQLVGWTGDHDLRRSAGGERRGPYRRWTWCLVIGILIILWIMIGITNLGKINLCHGSAVSSDADSVQGDLL